MFSRLPGALPLDIGHCPRSFFCGQALTVGTRNAFRSPFCRLLGAHPSPGCDGQNPLNPGIERAMGPFQYIRGTAP